MMTKLEKENVSAEYEWNLFLDNTDIDDVERARTEWEYARRMNRYSEYTIGYRLRKERNLSGLTQKEVASALGINETTIRDWEAGRHDISLKDAHRLMMLFRLIPGERTYETANLNDLTITPMDIIELARNEEASA